MHYLGIDTSWLGEDDDLEWRPDERGVMSVQKKPMDAGKMLLLAGAAYWMWRDKSKSKILPLALAWWLMTH